MKKNKKSAKVVFLGAFIALAVIAIAGMNMRTLINSDGLMGTARKAGANDAVVGEVLENYTFTSDTAGTGIMGSITDYSQTLTQLKLLASSANQIVTLPLNPGYYTQIKLDTTEVYESGYDAGFATAQHNHQFEHISDEKYYIKNGQTYNLPSNCNCVICGIVYYNDFGVPGNYFRKTTSWTYSTNTYGFHRDQIEFVLITYNITIDWPNNTITCSIDNSDAKLYIMPIY